MALNLDDNYLGLDNWGSMEECSDMESQDWVSFDDFKSQKGCEDISILLPKDPFGMDVSAGLHCDPLGMDINFCLPKDPFGMDLDIECAVSTITCWIENLELRTCAFEIGDDPKKDDDAKLIGELDLVWTSSFEFELGEEEDGVVDSNEVDVDTCCSHEILLHNQHFIGGSGDEFSCFGCEKYQEEHVKDPCVLSESSAPEDALVFVLDYLGIRDLLSVERVCKSLRDAVQNDPALWKNVHIDHPLNCKISNEDLLQLTNRAQGSLRSLSLINCKRITNIGLKQVLEKNLQLSKLSVPGCIELDVDMILHDLKAYNSIARPGIKHLRISDRFGITSQHLNEFKLLLGSYDGKNSGSYKPRFYHEGQKYLSLDDDRAIDLENCPRCQRVGQIYDCPGKSCQAKPDSSQTCRACISCIDRCINCGCCLDNTDFEETFCLDLICLDCLTQLFDARDTLKFFPTHTCFRQTASYHLVFCG